MLQAVRPFGPAWVFALGAVHKDPVRPMVLLLASLLTIDGRRSQPHWQLGSRSSEIIQAGPTSLAGPS